MRQTVGLMLLVATVGLGQGCAYLQNRGDDAREMIDLGFTVSDDPQFSMFVIFPPIHLTPFGIGEVNGRFVGLGGGHFRAFSPYYERSIGLGLWGDETVSFDKSWEQLSGLSEEELRREAVFYRTGVFGLADGPPPPKEYWVSCPHYLHLGWVGGVLSPRYSEALDFLLGWFLIDICGDDTAGME